MNGRGGRRKRKKKGEGGVEGGRSKREGEGRSYPFA